MRRAAVVTLLAPVLLASAIACGDDATSAGPEAGVTVDEIQEPQYFHEGEYLGQTVTVSAAVSDVLTPRHMEVAGTDYGEESLLVPPARAHHMPPAQRWSTPPRSVL